MKGVGKRGVCLSGLMLSLSQRERGGLRTYPLPLAAPSISPSSITLSSSTLMRIRMDIGSGALQASKGVCGEDSQCMLWMCESCGGAEHVRGHKHAMIVLKAACTRER